MVPPQSWGIARTTGGRDARVRVGFPERTEARVRRRGCDAREQALSVLRCRESAGPIETRLHYGCIHSPGVG